MDKQLFSIPEQVSRYIKKTLLQGNLKLGDKLPSENELANIFGVSRSTIRDALNILKKKYIIETRKGNQGGHFIAQKASFTMIESFNKFAFSPLGFGSPSLDQFFEFCFLIETQVAHLAAMHRSTKDLKDLKSHYYHLRNLCALSDSSSSLLQAVISFHRRLSYISHNPLIMETVDYLCQLSVVLSFQLLFSKAEQRLLLKTIDPIYRAIESQDASEAVQSMTKHLHFLSDAIKIKNQNIAFGV